MKNIYSAWLILLISSLSFSVVLAQTKEEVVALVKQTKSDIEKNSTLTFERINAGAHPYKNSENPSLYVFILDSELNVAAHAIKPHNVGKSFKGKPDVKGKLFRDEMKKKALSDGKGWVDYYYLNPKTKQVTHKNGYFELAEGSDGKKYIVGSGKYFDN